MKKLHILLFVMISCQLSALEIKPWLGNFLEFTFDGAFAYSRFTEVNNSLCPLEDPSNNYLVNLDLSFVPWPTVSTDFELQLAETPRQSFGYRSFATQFRYQILDDLLGDPISLTSSFNFRHVSSDSVRDISSPFHSKYNYELNLSAGKEWNYRIWWILRTFGFLAVGQGSSGWPWLTLHAAVQSNCPIDHQFRFFIESYIGFGGDKIVNIDDFNGWGKIQHRSIDLGIGYRYILGVWGSASLDYQQRVYAHSYPENEFALIFTYSLPFSVI